MKKIILVILSFFCFTLNPLAKEIIINDTSYEVSNSTLKLDGLTYSPNNNLLTLTDANLNSIETTEDLKIILNGHNKLNNLNSKAVIKAKNIEIQGPGYLNITSNFRGIIAENLVISNASINLDIKDIPILTNGIGNTVSINNSKLIVKSNREVFNVFKGYVYLNNSILEGEFSSLIDNFSNDIYLNSSNLNVTLTNTSGIIMNYIYVNGNSNIFMHFKNKNGLKEQFILASNLELKGSHDNLSYQEITDNTKYEYIKIIYTYQELLEKEKELERLTLELTKEKEKLKIQEEQLKDKENELNNNQLEINKKQEELELFHNNLLTREKELNILSLELTKEKEKLKIQEEQLKDKENELNNNQLEINKKQEELELFHNNLLTREKELNTLSLELTRKEQNVNKNNYKYCETLLNGTIENPKTFDDLFKYVILSILSLIIIVSIYLFKRRKHANL